MQALKNAKISAMILILIEEGMALRDAFDAVLGEGAYEKMVSDLYHDLRAKAGK